MNSVSGISSMITNRLQRETVVLVLGGGRGTRLFPLTRERSKPAVPLGGKFRFIDIALSNSINSGLRQIFVLTQYNSASLNNHVSSTYKFDTFSPGFVAILAAEQSLGADRGWFQGTADAVRFSLRYLRDPSFRNVLILPGDHLFRMNFTPMLEMHERLNADVTLCAAVVNRQDAPRFRVLKLGDDARVVELARKPEDTETLDRFRLTPSELAVHGINRESHHEDSLLASMGVYLVRREVLFRLLEDSEDQDLGRDTLPRIVWNTSSFCHVFSGYWRDIGTIKSFYEASMALTLEDPPFRFQDSDEQIFTHPRFLPSARIYRSLLDGALVADGAVIHQAHIERSVVGVRSKIHAGTHISHSVIFGADTFEGENRRAAAIRGDGLPPLGIGPNCVISRAIIDKNARIGAECRLENAAGIQHFDGENYYIRDGVIIIPKNTVLPPGTVI